MWYSPKFQKFLVIFYDYIHYRKLTIAELDTLLSPGKHSIEIFVYDNVNNNFTEFGGSQFVHVPNHGKRKVRYQKNGRAYVIVNKKKLKLT